jgi:filamentous hemagglutinin
MPQPDSKSHNPPRRRQSPWAAIAVGLVLLLVFGLLNRFGGSGEDPRPQASAQPETATSNPPTAAAARKNENEVSSLVIRNVRILNEVKHIIYSGDVDLRPTLDRIERGEKLRFANDGSVFENRERRLPRQARGYYHEYVHPTPGQAGPGAQRVVIGEEGETYYTPDHYRTFHRVR